MSERPDGFDAKRVELDAGPIRYLDSGAVDSGRAAGLRPRLRRQRTALGRDRREPGRRAPLHRSRSGRWARTPRRCTLTPTSPLPACARLISEFLRRLDLEDVTIVGNDSGGAVSQMLVTRHPDRIARLVLTNCDCFEKFPPQPFKAMFKAAQAPGGAAALARSMQVGAIRRGPLAYGGLTVKPIDETLLRSFVDPLLRGPGRPARRHALRRRRRHARHDGCRRQAARPARSRSCSPGATDDRFFTLEDARRLAGLIPDARLVEIAGAKTFVMLDEPERVAGEIAELRRRAAGGRSGEPSEPLRRRRR